MFQIKFYKLNKKNNSTKRPSGDGASFSCNIRTPSSIVNPIVELNTSIPKGYNYAFIEEFNRYYFIDDITFDRGLWVISLNVDVLATYKNEIGNTNMYVLRSASSSDGSIIDNMYPMIANNTTSHVEIFDWLGATGYYVITVVSGENGAVLYQLTPSAFSTFVNNMFVALDGYQFGNIIDSVLIGISNPMQYITNIKWYPFSVGSGTQVNKIRLGLYEINVSATQLNRNIYEIKSNTITIPKHPKANSRGKYLNLYPYSLYELDFLPFGVIRLDNSKLVNSNEVSVSVKIDGGTGIGELVVYGDTILVDTTGNFGVDIPLISNSTNMGNLLSSVAGGAVSMATGSVPGAVASIGGMIGSLIDPIGTTSMISSMGANMLTARYNYLRCVFYDITDEDNVNNGRPLAKYIKINTLNGYVQTQKGTVEIDGLDFEQNMVNGYMTTGFYYE